MEELEIALLGNVALDVTTFIGAGNIDLGLENCAAEEITACAGSCAVNHAMAMLADGVRPVVFSMYAADFLGELLLGDLRGRGIGTENILPMLRENNRTVLVVKGDGNKFMFSKRGAILEPGTLGHTFLPSLVRQRYVHVALNDWNRDIALELHRRCPGISLSTDLHLNARQPDEALLACMKIVFFSGANDSDPRATAERLLSLGPEIVICTLGENGCIVGSHEGGLAHYDAIKQQEPAVDTVGAGDVFAATFLSEYYRGTGLDDAVRMATIQAGHRVTRRGLGHLLPREALLAGRFPYI